METPNALVLQFPGTNCQIETGLALGQAGFTVTRAHVNLLLTGKLHLDEFHLLAIPGGFNYGDDIASGKVAANMLIYLLREQVREFAKDRLIIGICNGFQTIVKAGLLPAIDGMFELQATLTYSDIGHYYCNWIKLKNVNESKCIYTKGIDYIDLPMAHGEGKFMVKDQSILDAMYANDQVVFKYVLPNGEPANGKFPFNPANTTDDITGVCDPSGRIFGMMPHPERYLLKENHPRWTSGDGSDSYNGNLIFKNARDFVVQNLL
jgi:phosphoribosylformylglycinamidine synthase